VLCAAVTSSSSDVGRHHPRDHYHLSLSRHRPTPHRYLGPHAPPFSLSAPGAQRKNKEQFRQGVSTTGPGKTHDHYLAGNCPDASSTRCSTLHVAEGTPPPWPGEQPDDVSRLVIMSNTFWAHARWVYQTGQGAHRRVSRYLRWVELAEYSCVANDPSIFVPYTPY
jgi:hypothetical protein